MLSPARTILATAALITTIALLLPAHTFALPTFNFARSGETLQTVDDGGNGEINNGSAAALGGVQTGTIYTDGMRLPVAGLILLVALGAAIRSRRRIAVTNT